MLENFSNLCFFWSSFNKTLLTFKKEMQLLGFSFLFAEKIKLIRKDEALMKEIWDICQIDGMSTGLRHYYEHVHDGNVETDMIDRRRRIESSDKAMCVRYKTLIGFEHCSILYQSYLDDLKRKTITRWRLSSHKLKIETGRFSRPFTQREDRKCILCNVLEDEVHALYKCRAHRLIREKYKHLFNEDNREIQQLLNPTSHDDTISLAVYLEEIEENMKDLEMM